MTKKEAALLSVTKTFFKNKKQLGDAVEDDEILMVHDFSVEPARVGVEFGITVNMGNFESAKLAVRVEIPCYVEEIEEVYQRASDFAEEKAKKELKSVRGLVTHNSPF